MKDVVTKLIYTPVPKAFVNAVWPDAKRVLEKSVATANGKINLDDVYTGILNDVYVLWLVLDDEQVIAAATSRIEAYPGGQKGLAVDWLGGSRMTEWLPLVQKTMSEYAKSNGCTHLEAFGRKAWARWLGKYGWKPEYVAYRMELNNG